MNRFNFRRAQFTNPYELSGYEIMIKDLKNKIHNNNQSLQISTSLIIPRHPGPDKQKYAEELKKQIEEQARLRNQEKAESKKPGISESFNGYPNLPHIPEKMVKLQNMEQMKKIRDSLDGQLKSQKTIAKEQKIKNSEYEKCVAEKDHSKITEETAQMIMKKEKDREMLIKSWDLASKTIKLKRKLEESERKGHSSLNCKIPNDCLSSSSESQTSQEGFPIKNLSNLNFKSQNLEKLSKNDLIKKALTLRKSIEEKLQNYKIKRVLEKARHIRNTQSTHINNFQTSGFSRRSPSPISHFY
ncbi:hypothetical protein SteCoe_11812 [Stentor coeruleus]|uniref:Uncharacterized protein n=1 Tax=Stentor coeruleus TaxID=5963 RepID=A0A1R2CCB0_9CILI|nr:hypothetical protein SteCoe_11812 [Stentor coeruleus]